MPRNLFTPSIYETITHFLDPVCESRLLGEAQWELSTQRPARALFSRPCFLPSPL